MLDPRETCGEGREVVPSPGATGHVRDRSRTIISKEATAQRHQQTADRDTWPGFGAISRNILPCPRRDPKVLAMIQEANKWLQD